jgi:hypothetical protein
MMHHARLVGLTLGLLLSGVAQAGPTFINGLAIPGTSGDTYGTSVNDGRLGFFSDIYYDPNRNEWWGLSDRGPGGGTLSYETRVQRFTLDVDPTTGKIGNFQIAQTVKFSMNNAPMNGMAPSPSNALGNALDPEGFVINPRNGNFLVSDEYGPSLYEFNRSGQLVRAFITPDNLIPRNAATGTANYASDAGNTAGKRTNRGFEGLAVSPDGRYTYAMLQSAMLDEGGGNGSVNRIVKFDNATGQAVAQYAYQMKRSGQGQGISSLVAINDHEFFVLERNNRGIGVGAELKTADKEVYRIDLAGATDVSGIDLDAPGVLYTPVLKSAVILDLAATKLDLDGDGDKEGSPEKWEGLAIGPRLADGSYLLLAGIDNDYSVTQDAGGIQFDVWFDFNAADPYGKSIQCPLGQTTGCFWTTGGTPATLTDGYHLLPGVLHAYRATADDLAGYVAPIPEPGSLALMFAGLGVLGLMRKPGRGRAVPPAPSFG